MNIPKNESKASWKIKQKAINPESAQLHPILTSAPKHVVQQKDGYENWMLRTAQRGFKEDTCTGRPAGSRVEWDENLQMFLLKQ